MDENNVRTLLHAIADTPEPAHRIDIDRARRRGRRSLRVRRLAAPALAVVAVAAAVTVPRAIFSGTGERVVVPQASPTISAPVPAMPRSAPATLNPLVPYADFGWLPAGFSEKGLTPENANGVSSDTTLLTRSAESASSGRMLDLTVNAKGACRMMSAQQLLRFWRLPLQTQENDFQGNVYCWLPTSPAPDVNGKRALWIDFGSAIAWEYAPGAWASLTASIDPLAPRLKQLGRPGQLARHAAMLGWVLTPKAVSPRPHLGGGPPVDVSGEIRAGTLILPSAATKALLLKAASTVRYAQTTPIYFPFVLTRPLPDGWHVEGVSFYAAGGRLLSGGLAVGPAADTSALSISAGPQSWACNFVDGQSSYLTRYGVNWEYRVMIDHIAKNIQMLCSMQKVDGLQVNIYLDMAPEEAGAPPLPGSTQLGGAFGVYQKLRLLGADPANWTASPLG
jgi:hypothetical protein